MDHSEAQHDMSNQVVDSGQPNEGGIRAQQRCFSGSNQDEHIETDIVGADERLSASYKFNEVKHDTDEHGGPDDNEPYQAKGNSQDVGEYEGVEGISATYFDFNEHGILAWGYSLSLHLAILYQLNGAEVAHIQILLANHGVRFHRGGDILLGSNNFDRAFHHCPRNSLLVLSHYQ